MIIRELITRWGFDVDDDALRTVEKRLQSAKRLAAAATGAVTALGAGFFETARRGAEYAESVFRQSRALDIATDKYQELRFATQRYKVDQDDLNDAIGTVTDRMTDLQQGATAATEDFGLIGVGVQDVKDQKPGEFFEMVVERMGRMEDSSDRVAAAARIFGDDLARRLNPLLVEGADRLDELSAQAHETGNVWSEDMIATGHALAQTFNTIKEFLEGFLSTAQKEAIPIAKDWGDTVLATIRRNEELIDQRVSEAVQLTADALRATYEWGKTLVGGLDTLIQAFGGLESSAEIVKAILLTIITYQTITGLTSFGTLVLQVASKLRAMGAAAMWAQAKTVLIPAAIAALIVLLGYVIADFQAFFRGQKSAIGELVKRYPALGDAIYGLRDAWNAVDRASGSYFDNLPQKMENTKTRFFEWGWQIVDGWNNMTARLSHWWNKSIDLIKESWRDFFDWTTDQFGDLLGKVQGVASYVPGMSALTGLSEAQKNLEEAGELTTGRRMADQETNTTRRRIRSRVMHSGRYSFRSHQEIYQRPGESTQDFADRSARSQERRFSDRMQEIDDHFSGGEEY